MKIIEFKVAVKDDCNTDELVEMVGHYVSMHPDVIAYYADNDREPTEEEKEILE